MATPRESSSQRLPPRRSEDDPSVEAVYENGVLELAEPLPLAEHTRVVVTIHAASAAGERPAGTVLCTDRKLIEWAALDPELDLSPFAGAAMIFTDLPTGAAVFVDANTRVQVGEERIGAPRTRT